MPRKRPVTSTAPAPGAISRRNTMLISEGGDHLEVDERRIGERPRSHTSRSTRRATSTLAGMQTADCRREEAEDPQDDRDDGDRPGDDRDRRPGLDASRESRAAIAGERAARCSGSRARFALAARAALASPRCRPASTEPTRPFRARSPGSGLLAASGSGIRGRSCARSARTGSSWCDPDAGSRPRDRPRPPRRRSPTPRRRRCPRSRPVRAACRRDRSERLRCRRRPSSTRRRRPRRRSCAWPAATASAPW